MQTKLVNEVFALRDNEYLHLWKTPPTAGRWIAVMARSVSFPPGEFNPISGSGLTVAQAAIIGCEQVKDRWQWLHLSPATKEIIGDYLISHGLPKDVWCYIHVYQNT